LNGIGKNTKEEDKRKARGEKSKKTTDVRNPVAGGKEVSQKFRRGGESKNRKQKRGTIIGQIDDD